MARDDFNIEVKRHLALRAGYMCSMCGRPTAGPSEEDVSAVNQTGVAAHITAASPGGRRYVSTQTSAQRGSIENGIWLCSYHADLIDGDEVTYPISRLQQIKSQHEEKIKMLQSGLDVEQGLFTAIEIANFGEIGQAIQLSFAQRTIILGNNGVGKSLICEMIASLDKRKFLRRWRKRTTDITTGFCHITYFKNKPATFTISIPPTNRVSYSLDGIKVPFLFAPCRILYPNRQFNKFIWETRRAEEDKDIASVAEDDTVYWVARYFGMKKRQLNTVLKAMRLSKRFFTTDIRIAKDDTTLEVIYDVNNRRESFGDFRSFSAGEQDRIIVEICIQVALFYSRFGPTILLLENTALGVVDITGINTLLRIMKEEEFPFQLIFTSIEQKGNLDTSGYLVWELKRTGNTITPNKTDDRYIN